MDDTFAIEKDNKCKARPHHGNDCGKGAILDRDGNKCPGVAPASGDAFGSAVLDGRSFKDTTSPRHAIYKLSWQTQ